MKKNRTQSTNFLSLSLSLVCPLTPIRFLHFCVDACFELLFDIEQAPSNPFVLFFSLSLIIELLGGPFSSDNPPSDYNEDTTLMLVCSESLAF